MAKNFGEDQDDGRGEIVFPSSSVEGTGGFKLDPELYPYFVLTYSPLDWELYKFASGEYKWIPRLKPNKLKPGVNGVRGGGRQQVDARAMLGNLTSWGMLVIPEAMGYIKRVRAIKGACYMLRFETPRNVGSATKVRCDDEEYALWRLKLVENGIVPPPEPEVLEGLIDRMRGRAGRALNRAHIPEVRKKIDEVEARVAAGEKAAKKLEGYDAD